MGSDKKDRPAPLTARRLSRDASSPVNRRAFVPWITGLLSTTLAPPHNRSYKPGLCRGGSLSFFDPAAHIMHFQRKNIRLPTANYHSYGPFFITLCCDRRFSAFNDAEAFTRRAIEILHTTASRQAFIIYAYCFMPDHLHALVAGTSPSDQPS